MTQNVSTKQEWNPAASGNLVVWIRRAFESNYFYFLSAALMLLGSYMLMPDKELLGEPFWPTVRCLLALQGYELLVILTAAVIVRRLRVLDDAFMLLLIEITLLLDPTFFSNSFATMLRAESTAVNVVCLALVPIKLLILQKTLRLRVSPEGWVAFLFAAAFVYLAEGPLACDRLPEWTSHDALLYALTWAPLLFVCLAPRPDAFARSTSSRDDHIASGRLRGLQWTLFVLPLAVMIAHIAESAFVHELDFHGAYLAPFVLAAAVAFVRWGRLSDKGGNLIVLDVALACALFLATPWWNTDSSKSLTPTEPLPWFMQHHVPFLLTGLSAMALYIAYYARTHYRPALWRIALMIVAGSGWGLWQIESVRLFVQGCGSAFLTGVRWVADAIGSVCGYIWDMVATVFGWIGSLIATIFRFIWKIVSAPFEWIGDWLSYWRNQTPRIQRWIRDHPSVVLSIPWVVLLVAALRLKRFATSFAAAQLGIWILFGFLPGRRSEWLGEYFQIALVAWLVLDHLYDHSKQHAGRYTLAFFTICSALGRYLDADATAWPLLAVLAHTVGFGIAAWRARHPGYFLVPVLAVLFIGGRTWHSLQIDVSPAIVVMGAALAVFAMGVAVTFNKERVLQFFDAMTVPPPISMAPRKEALVEEPAPCDRTDEAELQTQPDGEPAPGEEKEKDASESEEPSPPVEFHPNYALDMRRFIETLLMEQPTRGIHLARGQRPDLLMAIASDIGLFEGEEIVALIGEVGARPRKWRLLLTTHRLVQAPGLVRQRKSILYSQMSWVRRSTLNPNTLRIEGHSQQAHAISMASSVQAACLGLVLHHIGTRTWREFVEEMADRNGE